MARAASKGNCLSRTLIAFLVELQVNCMVLIVHILICIVNDWTWSYNNVPFSYSDASIGMQKPTQGVGASA